MTPNIPNRFTSIAALSIIITLGLIHSVTVLGGDQSLFVVIAQLVDSGKVLYQDLFDYKQPGIFLFYLLAGKTLGWSDISIHLFELGYWLIFSVILILTLKQNSLFRNEYFAGLMPLFIVGVYYCNATPFHLTQLEALVSVPLFLIVWLLDKAYKDGNRLFITYLAIGGLIGIVLLCKLVFAPIIFCFLLIHLIFVIRKNGWIDLISKKLMPLILGFAVPVSLFLFYIFNHHIENLVWDIFFKIPASVVNLDDQVDPERLLNSIKWFGKRMLAFLLLAVIGVLIIFRKEPHFAIQMVLWGIVGFLVILMQKTSWWSYHLQLLYVPIGFFSAIGLDFILYHLLQRIKLQSTVLAVGLLTAMLLLVFNMQIESVKRGMSSHNHTKLYSYDYAKEDAANLLTALNEEDTIFVCGNPRMYILASRLPELSTNGWILEYYLDFQWEQFYNEFVNKPPTYLFVKNDYDDLIETKHNKLWQFMMSQYTEFDSVENGKWYKKI
ncbi:MAG: hypothetical protein DYH15_06010 [Nitrosomonas sp. PRO4]|nr:hypothetical protein [Nitrosomonas sp. PRO4]